MLIHTPGKWIRAEVKHKTTRLKVVTVNHPVNELTNVENAYATDYLITKAQQYAKKYRPCETPPATLKKQYAVILPATMKHFEDWILDPARTEPLKMREKNIAARHIVGLKEPRYTTYPRYKKDCKDKGIKPLPRETYTDLLGMQEFMDLKQDDCMCAKCLAYGWRGIHDGKKQFFKEVQTLGKKMKLFDKKTDPTRRLTKRLDRAWNHLRTTYSQHLKSEDELACHCLRRQLGHSCNKHLDTPCNHTRSDGDAPSHPVKWEDVGQTAGNRSLGGRWDATCEVCSSDCGTGGGRKVSLTSWRCRHCCHSCCNDCQKTYYPAEGPGESYTGNNEYICNRCSADIDLVKHRPGGCAHCEDLEHLPTDILHMVDKIEKVVGVEMAKGIRFKAEKLVQNFKDFSHHMARVAQQELHWPAVLEQMKKMKQYHKVYLVFIRL